jgi:hypothetical protein
MRSKTAVARNAAYGQRTLRSSIEKRKRPVPEEDVESLLRAKKSKRAPAKPVPTPSPEIARSLSPELDEETPEPDEWETSCEEIFNKYRKKAQVDADEKGPVKAGTVAFYDVKPVKRSKTDAYAKFVRLIVEAGCKGKKNGGIGAVDGAKVLGMTQPVFSKHCNRARDNHGKSTYTGLIGQQPRYDDRDLAELLHTIIGQKVTRNQDAPDKFPDTMRTIAQASAVRRGVKRPADDWEVSPPLMRKISAVLGTGERAAGTDNKVHHTHTRTQMRTHRGAAL